MKYTIAILITTFLRDSLLYKCIQSIVENYTNECIVLIGDQGYSSEEKTSFITQIQSIIPLEYYKLPFDCGAYTARNFLVKKASEMNIPYILLGADSIHFSDNYDFEPYINFLNNHSEVGLCGFELNGSKCPWEYLMEVLPSGIFFSCPTNTITENNVRYIKVDIMRNIFLAKTQTLINYPWDEDLKLGGHELYFWKLKQHNIHCYWTASLKFQRISSNVSEEYKIYRGRWSEQLKIALKKMGTKAWVKYPKKKT